MSKKIQTNLDLWSSADFETHGVLRRIFDFFFLPILNNLPSRSISMIKKTHNSAREVVEHKTTHRALESLYQKGNNHRSENWIHKIFHGVWFNTANSKAVRNRLKIVKMAVSESVKDMYAKNGRVKILSIASGSARAIIESVSEIGLANYPGIEIYFLDKNPAALEYSRTLTISNGISEKQCRWIEGTAGSYLKDAVEKSEKFDLIEMVGLLDYFDSEKTLELLKLIFTALSENGVLITANINHNDEKEFVTNVIGWPMNYKTPDELKQLIILAGFSSEKLEIYVEPFEIHTVIRTEK